MDHSQSLFFTPRTPYGTRMPKGTPWQNHMRASENRGTMPNPAPGASFRLAGQKNQNIPPAAGGQGVKPQPLAQAPASFDPNAKLYRVTGDPKTGVPAKFDLVDPKDIKAKNATIWINGMANDPQHAAELGLFHTGKSDFYMIHNPTHGAADLGECAVQKLGLRTKVADSTRDLLRHFDLPSATVTAHSQGTMIVNSALGDLRKEGKDMRGLTLNYHGAAANSLLSRALAQRIGAHVNEFTGHALDPVHNIVGMNTLNPLRIAGSVLAAPLLFNKDRDVSPHSKPDGQAKRLGPVFQSPLFHPLLPRH